MESVKARFVGSAVTVIILASSVGVAQAVTFQWATVDQDLSNAADVTGFGSVSYAYRISKHEVTNAQYTEFLNAVAATDPLELYNANMGSGTGGITRSGSPGAYTYSTSSGRENHPVTNVSWYDSVRFINWLHNGQGGSDTETGAYTLEGGTPIPSNGLTVTRNTKAEFFMPSEDEWYKAAYHDPATDEYFLFATSSNATPTRESPPGGNNSANYGGVVGVPTDVGAYTRSVSPFGTFDQSGNVFEWNEALIDGARMGVRGGSWNPDRGAVWLSSSRRLIGPTSGGSGLGFRVASEIPEPGTLLLVGVGIVVVMRRGGG